MKTTIKSLLAVTMAVFCCPIAKADNIIYSNNFALGTGIDISNTPPTVANTYAGGISSARWVDIYGASNPNPGLFLLDTGVNMCPNGDYWCLPFTPQTNHVYLLTVNLTFTNGVAAQPEIGFSINSTNVVTDGRFNGSDNGYDWMALAYGTGNVQYFAGNKTANTILAANGVFPANTASTNTIQILLDTRGVLSANGTNWSVAGYVNGRPAGNIFTYSGANPALLSVGITENSAPNPPSMVQFNSFVLTTTLQPFIVQQPTPAKIVGGGSAYTNSVTVMADTNGGPLFYQWYANNLPLANGVNNILSGANSNVLVINPVATANQFTNYYVIVTNNFGSATSSVASLTVLTNATITAPLTLSNSINLFAGTGGVLGSSPSFSVTAVGAPPLVYRWFTNGVLVSGATNNSLVFTNLQLNGPTNFTCTVSNVFGPTNATWYATYASAPTAAYPQAVLGDVPFAFYRLNESDDGSGNKGAICHDYQSGNNGIYTNVLLGQDGYNTLEQTETSMYVTVNGPQPSCVSRVIGGDLAAIFTNGTSATFTVEAWANCISGNGISGGAPVVAQGTNGGSSFFLGVDTNSTKHFQFYVRNAAGTMFSADNTTGIEADDGNWHYLVGVCDEVHSNVTLYVDGILAATTAITPATGLFESGFPVAIGAGIRIGASDYNIPFTGNIDDVAIYTHALTIGQVVNHEAAANGNTVALTMQAPLAPTNIIYVAGRPLTIPVTVTGSGPVGYTWTDVTSGTMLASGTTTNSGTFDATLTIANATVSLSGDQLELVVTNPVSSTNIFVTIAAQPAPVALDYSSPILYSNAFNGGTYNLAGLSPSAVNLLVGGTNTLWIDGKITNNGVMQANGTPTSALQDSWVLPFTPEPGYIYTLTATVTFTANPGNWVALGFFQNLTNAADARINGGLNGYDWLLVQFTGNVQSFAGPAGTGPISNAVIATVGVASHTIQIVLDTTTNSANWMAYSFVDGHSSGTNKYTTKPTVIGGVGIAQNAPTVPSAIQWSSFALTQMAPGGVPPYLLSPLPPTNNIVLSNAMVAINATAFGSAPLGYYWTNNGTVVASGTTSTPPLSASLNVASSSLSAGQLKLVVTNAFGTNITTITLVSPVNTNAGPIQYSVTNNQLTLSWPTNLGWTLQAQTNPITVGKSTNWVNVANSTTTNQVTVPISPANGSVFYRLILP